MYMCKCVGRGGEGLGGKDSGFYLRFVLGCNKPNCSVQAKTAADMAGSKAFSECRDTRQRQVLSQRRI